MAYIIKQVKTLRTKAASHQIIPFGDSIHYLVISGASGQEYIYDVSSQTCSCARQQWITGNNDHRNHCSHGMAAMDMHYRITEGTQLVARNADEEVAHLHRRVIPAGDGVKYTGRTGSHRRRQPNYIPTNEVAEALERNSLAAMTLDDLNSVLFG